MRKIIILLLASLFLFFSCDLGVGEPSVKKTPSWDSRIPEDFLGVIAGEVGISGSGVDEDKADVEYDFVDSLGAKWILRTFYWNDIQKNANPDASTWDWSFYDNFVNTVHARGFKIFAVLAYANNAVTGDTGTYISPGVGKDPGNPESPVNYNLFANYVTQVIARYGNKIAGYSIWNEPNEIPRFWEGQPEEIITLCAYGAAAARATMAQVNPNGKLLAGVLNSLAIDDWTEGFFSGAMLNTDGVAYHPYMPGAQRAADLFSAYQNLVSKYGYANKIWITEAGFPTGGQYVSLVKEDNMPEEVIKTITLLAARGAAHVFWYELFDDNDHVVTDSEDWFGLATYDSTTNVITKKKGADAFALCGKYIPGTVYRPVTGGSGIQAYCFQGEEESALILWADTKAVSDTVEVEVTLRGTDWKQYDIVDGTGTALSGETVSLSLGKTPVFLSWKPAGKASPSISTP
jgi:hypothetical protein